MIRFLLLNGHYRTKLNFSLSKRTEAEQAIQRIINIKSKLKTFKIKEENKSGPISEHQKNFISALEDDLDTPKALAILYIWIKDTFKEIDKNNFNKINVQAGLNFLEVVENLLGIIPPKINIPEKIQKLVDKRLYAKKKKNWEVADLIRQELIDLGWKLEDTVDGTVCKPI